MICICIFCVIGSVLEGPNCFKKYSDIAGTISLQTAFLITVASAVSITIMTLLKMPVSTTQTVVGAIMGATIASKGAGAINMGELGGIVVCWIGTPIGAMIIAYILYFVIGAIWNQFFFKRIELMDKILKGGLVVAGCYGAYALGANNVANVVGIFKGISIGGHVIDDRMLALIGALAICVGVITFSKGVMMTVGENLVPLVPFTAFIAVLAEAATVHFYALIGVPVSTGQAMVGAVLGMGLVKGMRSVNNKVITNIGIAWVTSPLSAGIVSFLLIKHVLKFIA